MINDIRKMLFAVQKVGKPEQIRMNSRTYFRVREDISDNFRYDIDVDKLFGIPIVIDNTQNIPDDVVWFVWLTYAALDAQIE